ncbi:hypothetical protein EPD60_05295 [Flaviaesturariibacter flavus]|uniref:Uncharacterized protein n=1 Tax=Flaviaesturariibacter flavus TaxID=2502780 RepID=A0A4R1BJU2_9BACT|nr:hypothetical protein [Flaviaesturariibacter flavus]TCJ17611.1 hypothetical protein EPD60_05295 [Flaviaesturariibacter flavus]
MEARPINSRLVPILLLHLPLAGSYMVLTGFAFVVMAVPNPVLIGIIQGACIGLHLALTPWLCFRLQVARSLVMAHLATVFLVIAVLQLTNHAYWNMLWQLRHS